jgi:hypothetical protein
MDDLYSAFLDEFSSRAKVTKSKGKEKIGIEFYENYGALKQHASF